MGPIAVVTSGRRWISYVVQDPPAARPPLHCPGVIGRDDQAEGIVTLLDFRQDNLIRYTLILSRSRCIHLQVEYCQCTLADLLPEQGCQRQPIVLGVALALILGVNRVTEFFHSKELASYHIATETVSIANSICLVGYELSLVDGQTEGSFHHNIWGLAGVAFKRLVLPQLELPNYTIQKTLETALHRVAQVGDYQMQTIICQMLTLKGLPKAEVVQHLMMQVKSYPELIWYSTLDELESKGVDPTDNMLASLHDILGLSKDEVLDLAPNLQAAVKAFIQQGSRWIRQHAAAVIAHLDEASDGSALMTLLNGLHSGKYVLTAERAALIRALAEKEGDCLLKTGYTIGYIRALRGFSTTDIDIQPDGWNSWFRYAEQGNVQCLKSLLKQARTRLGISFTRNYLVRSGVTALMIASALNHPHVVELLAELEHGLVEEHASKTALMIAVEYNSLDAARILVKSEACLQTQDHKTALILAVNRNHLESVIILHKIECRMKDATATTALMQAARYGYLDIVKTLAEDEAGMQNSYGETALTLAIKHNHPDTAAYLLTLERELANSTVYTPLMAAAESNNVELAKRFLGEHKGRQDRSRMTAMMYAAQHGHKEIVELLLPEEKTMQNSMGDTAMMLATKFNCFNVVALLAPYEKSIANNTNETVLTYATRKNIKAIIELLE